MLDEALLRDGRDGDGAKILLESLVLRCVEDPDALLNQLFTLWEAKRHLRHRLDMLRSEIRKISKDIAAEKKAKREPDPKLFEKRMECERDMEKFTQESDSAEAEFEKTFGALGNLVERIKNEQGEEVISKDEEFNPVWKVRGPESFGRAFADGSKLLNHHELLEKIDGYEAARGCRVAGHRGYYLKGAGFWLNQALQDVGMAYLVKKGFTPVQPPFFMNKEVMAKTAQLSQFDEELYGVSGDGEKYLIATSEQPLSALHMKEWLSADVLPIRYAGVSTNFRREAGAHGKEAWGIFRVHQFEKIEQFCITSPECSKDVLTEMVGNAEGFLELLEIPYQRVQIVTGALNNAAAEKYDVEGWFPARKEYKELMSVSNCTDYQSRSLEIRFGEPGKKKGAQAQSKKFVHMLNGTLIATQRALCCVLENYQTPEGIAVPKALQPYLANYLGDELRVDLPEGRKGCATKDFIPFGSFAQQTGKTVPAPAELAHAGNKD